MTDTYRSDFHRMAEQLAAESLAHEKALFANQNPTKQQMIDAIMHIVDNNDDDEIEHLITGDHDVPGQLLRARDSDVADVYNYMKRYAGREYLDGPEAK